MSELPGRAVSRAEDFPIAGPYVRRAHDLYDEYEPQDGDSTKDRIAKRAVQTGIVVTAVAAGVTATAAVVVAL
jgi:hypothetical protein